jgi:hypothetical protein
VDSKTVGEFIFLYESTFHLVNSGGTKAIRLSSISQYKQWYTIPTMKHSVSYGMGMFQREKGERRSLILPKTV